MVEQAEATPRSGLARLLGIDPLHPGARNWFAGALGELEVARILGQLGSDFTVLHAVPLNSGDLDIDHVVIGPPGIFTITTLNHSGSKVFAAGQTMLVDGERTDHMQDSLREARRAAELLRRASGGVVTVRPLIVVVGVDTVSTDDKQTAVTVLPASRLAHFLQHEPVALRGDAIAYFSNAAEDRATWHSQASDPFDSTRVAHRFGRLRQEVDASRLRRTLWRTGALLAAIVTVTAVALELLHAL